MNILNLLSSWKYPVCLQDKLLEVEPLHLHKLPSTEDVVTNTPTNTAWGCLPRKLVSFPNFHLTVFWLGGPPILAEPPYNKIFPYTYELWLELGGNPTFQIWRPKCSPGTKFLLCFKAHPLLCKLLLFKEKRDVLSTLLVAWSVLSSLPSGMTSLSILQIRKQEAQGG